jgi:hypothetical protein
LGAEAAQELRSEGGSFGYPFKGDSLTLWRFLVSANPPQLPDH